MSVCPQCGSPTKDNDKFCNGCGYSLAQAATPAAAAPPQAEWGAPPPPQPAWGAPPKPADNQIQQGYVAPGVFGQSAPQAAASPYGPPPGAAVTGQGGYGGPTAQPSSRCQQGHEIQPGASYCAAGHPIALDAMQFASDAYGAPPPPAPPAYQPPTPAQNPYGAPQQPNYGAFGSGQPQQSQQGYGQPPQNFGYGAPNQPAPPPAYAPQAAFAPPQPAAFAPPPAQMAAQMAEAPHAGAGQVPNRILRGFLCSFQANTQGEFWPLHGGRVGVGRANAGETVDIQLADATISSRHAALLVDNVSGAISVEDTGSTNGTYVNDEHLGFNGRRELRDGDRLRFGGFTTIVKVIGRVS